MRKNILITIIWAIASSAMLGIGLFDIHWAELRLRPSKLVDDTMLHGIVLTTTGFGSGVFCLVFAVVSSKIETRRSVEPPPRGFDIIQ